MKKINYCTPYTDGEINGYVIAEEHPDHYSISRSQYRRALKKLTIGGDIGPKFLSDKPVRVI